MKPAAGPFRRSNRRLVPAAYSIIALAVRTGRQRSETVMNTIDQKLQKELESAVLHRLIDHLRKKPQVQNIDLMNLAGFCRNCLANWYQDAAKARGLDLSRNEARDFVYGMPYEEWKAQNQLEATEEQKKSFAAAHKDG